MSVAYTGNKCCGIAVKCERIAALYSILATSGSGLSEYLCDGILEVQHHESSELTQIGKLAEMADPYPISDLVVSVEAILHKSFLSADENWYLEVNWPNSLLDETKSISVRCTPI